jgi:diaminopimelate epimerase
MNGSGNDFILIDNREGVVGETGLQELVRSVCRRQLSIGADGLILVESSRIADFKWQFFNADGSRAEMCGNGARCAARFAKLAGIAGKAMSFETDAGLIRAEMIGDRVKVGMTEPHSFVPEIQIPLPDGAVTGGSLNTGVPHVVIDVGEALETTDIASIGRAIRFHDRFKPAGTNVNFIRRLGDQRIAVRTYERGVEGETLACGTGCVASALIVAHHFDLGSPIHTVTRSGGVLTIYFGRTPTGFASVFMEGDARLVCTGDILPDALMA